MFSMYGKKFTRLVLLFDFKIIAAESLKVNIIIEGQYLCQNNREVDVFTVELLSLLCKYIEEMSEDLW